MDDLSFSTLQWCGGLVVVSRNAIASVKPARVVPSEAWPLHYLSAGAAVETICLSGSYLPLPMCAFQQRRTALHQWRW